MKNIIVPVYLKKLSDLVDEKGYQLYIVGGYVRDSLLGLKSSDIDICGNIPLDNMIEMATSLGFSTTIIQRELGTLLLKRGSQEMEYTRFRSELYDKGNHVPSEVTFVNELNIDAKRRDFTINCIYYDIKHNKLIDPYNGQYDLKDRKIKTVETPKFVLSRDGLRILRTMRFAQELGFGIDLDTYKACIEYRYLLRDISKERILVELKKTFFAYQKCGREVEPVVILRILNEWKIWKEIIPTISFEKICLSYHQLWFWAKDQNILVYKFYKNVYTRCPKELGYLGFLVMFVLSDIGEHLSTSNIPYSVMKVLGNDGLKESNHYKKSVEKLLFCMLRRAQFETKLSYRQFAIAYHEYSEREKQLLHLMDDSYYTKLEGEYLDLQLKNIPLSVVALDLKADDLKELGYPENQFGKILNKVWSSVLLEELPNKKENLIKYLQNSK